jgi:hypothetical protein
VDGRLGPESEGAGGLMVSERTKAGLAAFNARVREAVKARAEALRPILVELAGMSANAIAAELNRRNVPTPTGRPWSAVTVIWVQRRLAD